MTSRAPQRRQTGKSLRRQRAKHESALVGINRIQERSPLIERSVVCGADLFRRQQLVQRRHQPAEFFLPRLASIDRGAFIGLTAAAGPAEMARAVY